MRVRNFLIHCFLLLVTVVGAVMHNWAYPESPLLAWVPRNDLTELFLGVGGWVALFLGAYTLGQRAAGTTNVIEASLNIDAADGVE